MSQSDRIKHNIKHLLIQGATNVALATIDGIEEEAKSESGETVSQTITRMKKVGEALAFARPTEPLAQNAVRYVFANDPSTVDDCLKRVIEYKEMIETAHTYTVKHAAELVRNGGTYLTHCHSTTVTGMFKKAHNMGKKFSVIATETRPLWQGRKTVSELLEAGLSDVTLIVDSAASAILLGKLKPVDTVFVGCDLLSQEGFVNKIGTRGIAHAASSVQVPVYTLTSLLKYHPQPFSNDLIEDRASDEIFPDPPSGLHVFAPAFDFTPFSSLVHVICEEGITEGSDVPFRATHRYPFLTP